MAEELKKIADHEHRTSFVFYESFKESAEELNDTEYRQFMTLLFEYAFYGKEPDENTKGYLKALFKLIKPQIDANNERRENGKKGAEYGKKGAEYGKLGGRPKKEKPPTNPPKTPQKPPTNPPNVNVNVNVNDNVNVNANAVVKPDEPTEPTEPKTKTATATAEKITKEQLDRLYSLYGISFVNERLARMPHISYEKLKDICKSDADAEQSKAKSQGRANNSFNSMPHNNYDFDELERIALLPTREDNGNG